MTFSWMSGFICDFIQVVLLEQPRGVQHGRLAGCFTMSSSNSIRVALSPSHASPSRFGVDGALIFPVKECPLWPTMTFRLTPVSLFARA